MYLTIITIIMLIKNIGIYITFYIISFIQRMEGHYMEIKSL
jgi:hypothetical protein